MNHKSSKLIPSVIVAFTMSAPLAIRAQDSDPFGALYSQGVEYFFAGRTGEADSYFSRAIAINPNDPRAYYFRSLSRLREGRQTDARADMQTGAELESRQPNRFAIGKTLERVQGPARLLLEQYRSIARLNQALTSKRNLPAVAEPDTAVLREQRVVPLDEFMQSGAPRSSAVPAAAPAKTSSPVAPAARPVENQNTSPAGEANPFGDDTAPKVPAQPPAAKSTAPPAPKTPPPAEEPPAKDDNPFL